MTMRDDVRFTVLIVFLAPAVVVLVTGFLYLSFLAWVSFLVLCLHKAQVWGWWP